MKKAKVILSSLIIGLFLIIFLSADSNVKLVSANNNTTAPDLVIQDLFWVPASPINWQPVTFYWKVRNIGGSTAPQSITSFSTETYSIGWSTPPIAAGSFYPLQKTYTYAQLSFECYS